MTTTNVIAILLFILPGIFAEKISHKMDFPSGKKRNDFMQIVNGIALSFPILFIVAIFIRWQYKFNTFSQYVEEMNKLDFLFKICGYTLIISFFVGVLFLPIKTLISWITNRFRSVALKKMEVDDKACWRKFLIDDYTYKYLEVIKDGNSYRGFMGPFSLPDESREIILYTPQELLDNPEYDDKQIFKVVKSIYIDLEKNIVVHDYDTKDYDVWCQNQISCNKNNTSILESVEH